MTVLPDLFEERNKIVLLCRVFETGGRTYFTLLSDRFITCANKIGSSATRALLLPDKETSLHPLQPWLWWP